MVLRKNIIRLAGMIAVALGAGGCSLGLGGAEISIKVDELTALPAPTNLHVENDYIYWDEVPNASSYIVRVNSWREAVGNALKYSLSAIVDSRLEAGVPTELHIYVQAKGNQILYSDSDWSLECLYTYTKPSSPVESSSSTSETIARLSVPTGISFSDNIVSWNPVEHAIGYEMNIDGELLTTSALTYSPSFEDTRDFTFSIRAKASSYDGYEDSDWSLPTTFRYQAKTATVDFSDRYRQSGLGMGIDLINGEDYHPSRGVVSIFNTEKLYSQPLSEMMMLQQESSISQGYGFSSFATEWQERTRERVSLSATVQFAKFLSAGLSVGLDVDESYQKVSKAETKEFWYKLQQNIVNRCVYIEGYKDSDRFSSMLSTQFINDADKVGSGAMSAEAFVSKYGTHVIMGGYYGGYIDAQYAYVGHNSSTNQEWYASATSNLTQYLLASADGVGAGESESVDFETQKRLYSTSASDDHASFFRVKAVGGTSEAFGDASNFMGHYSDWAKTVTWENSVLIDFPRESLYCVWDYLGDEHIRAKEILDTYLIEKCNDIYDELYRSIGTMYLTNPLEYDEGKQAIVIDFTDEHQSKCSADPSASLDFNSLSLSFGNWISDSSVKIYPMYDFKPVKKVEIIDCYGKPNRNGQIVTGAVMNFSLVIDESFASSDLEIELNSTFLISKNGAPVIDSSKCESVTLTSKHHVKLATGGSVAAPRGTIEAGGLVIKGYSEAAVDIVGGNASPDGGVGGSAVSCDHLAIEGELDISAKGGNGINGKEGGTAIYCKNEFRAVSSTIELQGGFGGDGVNGKDGANGVRGNDGVCGSDYTDGTSGTDGADGKNGGDGGRGGTGLVCGHADVRNASISVKIPQNGAGGKGGNGGNGGDAGHAGSNGWYVLFVGWKSESGQAGNGGNGGNGGSGGSTGFTALPYSIADGSSLDSIEMSLVPSGAKSGQAGNGGNGGRGGNTGCGSQTWGQDRNKAGCGGNGGDAGCTGNVVILERYIGFLDNAIIGDLLSVNSASRGNGGGSGWYASHVGGGNDTLETAGKDGTPGHYGGNGTVVYI